MKTSHFIILVAVFILPHQLVAKWKFSDYTLKSGLINSINHSPYALILEVSYDRAYSSKSGMGYWGIGANYFLNQSSNNVGIQFKYSPFVFRKTVLWAYKLVPYFYLDSRILNSNALSSKFYAKPGIGITAGNFRYPLLSIRPEINFGYGFPNYSGIITSSYFVEFKFGIGLRGGRKSNCRGWFDLEEGY